MCPVEICSEIRIYRFYDFGENRRAQESQLGGRPCPELVKSALPFKYKEMSIVVCNLYEIVTIPRVN